MLINHLSRQGKQLKNTFQRKKAVLFQMKCSSIYAVYLFLRIITASKNRTLEWLSVFTLILSTAFSIVGTRQWICTYTQQNSDSCLQRLGLPICVRFSMSVRPKWLQQHDGITHDVLARKCKAILLGKSLQLFHENPKIGPLVFGKKSQILSSITLPASHLFHELWG